MKAHRSERRPTVRVGSSRRLQTAVRTRYRVDRTRFRGYWCPQGDILPAV